MKNNKGITLIALVVTIIVLLILAGVSIAMLTGQNGILNNARKASYESKLKDAADTISFNVMDKLTEYYNNAYATTAGSTSTVPNTISDAIDACLSTDKNTVKSDSSVKVESHTYEVTGTGATLKVEGKIKLTYNGHSIEGDVTNAGVSWGTIN